MAAYFHIARIAFVRSRKGNWLSRFKVYRHTEEGVQDSTEWFAKELKIRYSPFGKFCTAPAKLEQYIRNKYKNSKYPPDILKFTL